MSMALISRKDVVFTILLYSTLFSRTQTQDVCSCQNPFQQEHFDQLCDVSINSQRCDDCSENVTQRFNDHRCATRYLASSIYNHRICPSPVSTNLVRYYRCEVREGIYTCIVPSVIPGNLSIAFYSALILNYHPNACRSYQTTMQSVLHDAIPQHTSSLADCCVKLSACISPLRVLQNVPNAITLTFEVSQSYMVIDSDAVLAVNYISACHNTISSADSSPDPYLMARLRG